MAVKINILVLFLILESCSLEALNVEEWDSQESCQGSFLLEDEVSGVC